MVLLRGISCALEVAVSLQTAERAVDTLELALI